MSRIGGKKVTLLNIVLQSYRPAMSATQSLYSLTMGSQTQSSGIMVKTGVLDCHVGRSSPVKDRDELLISVVKTLGSEATSTIDDKVLLTMSRLDSCCMG
jgi:hypothetical protein